MIITVLGATGRTGRLVVDQALDSGHRVHALVRRTGVLSDRDGLTVLEGDARSAESVAEASRATDAIVSALDTGTGPSMLIADSTRAIIEASRTTGVRRLLVVSSYSAGATEHLTAGRG